MNLTIRKLLEQYKDECEFNFAKFTENMRINAEKELGLKLPGQYLDFLREYGYGGIGGSCTLGVGLDGSLIFVEETQEQRKNGLPLNLVVIENCDEWLYCIDCDSEAIVSWDLAGYIKAEYESFDDYLLDQINDAIENM